MDGTQDLNSNRLPDGNSNGSGSEIRNETESKLVAERRNSIISFFNCEALQVEYKLTEPNLSLHNAQREFVKDVLGLYHANVKSYLVFGINEQLKRPHSNQRPEFTLEKYFKEGRATVAFKEMFLRWTTAVPLLRYDRHVKRELQYSVLTIERCPFPIFLTQDINDELTTNSLVVRCMNSDGMMQVRGIDRHAKIFKAKLEEFNKVFAPLLELMHDSSSFVVWMRCPWPDKKVPQTFPKDYKLRADCVLDFAEDFWSKPATRTKKGTKKVTQITYINGPDILCRKFPQFTYCRLDESQSITDPHSKWISVNVPNSTALQGITINKLRQDWSKLFKKSFLQLIDAIKKRRDVTLVVTAFGNGLWNDVVMKTLLREVFALTCDMPAFNCVVLSEVDMNYERATWIKCTAREFVDNLPYLGIIVPQPNLYCVNVNGELKALSDQQERTVVRYFDVVAQCSKLCVNGNTVDDEDIGMTYLRGGDWSWRDGSRMLFMNQKFHQEALQTVQQWIGRSKSHYQLKIAHKHGEGGTSAAVRLSLELAKTHPVLVLKSDIQLTNDLFVNICASAQQLSHSLSSPVIVFLHDNALPNVSLQGQGTSKVVFISCHPLDWNEERLQVKRPLAGSIYGTEIPLPRSIDQPLEVAHFYMNIANSYHERYNTRIEAASPIDINTASAFDFSSSAFFGSDVTLETHIESYLATCSFEDKEHLLWIAMIQLYTNVNVSLDWFKDRNKWPRSVDILQEQQSMLVSVNYVKSTIRFCHSRVARLIFDKLIREINLESMVKYFNTLPENSLLHQLLFKTRLDDTLFSPFIARLWSYDQFQALKFAMAVANSMHILPEIRCRILIVVIRMLLQGDKTTQEQLMEMKCMTSTQLAEKYAVDAMLVAESLESSTGTASFTAAVNAQLGYIRRAKRCWRSAVVHFARSLELQPTSCGVMRDLIELNCTLIAGQEELELARWIETVKWFYVLSLKNPRRCYTLSDQLAVIQQLKPAGTIINKELQIAFLQLQMIVDGTEKFDKIFLRLTDREVTPNLSYSLPSTYQKEVEWMTDLVFRDIATSQSSFGREAFIPVSCPSRRRVARWLWSTEGWIAIHNRQYWDVNSSAAYDSYKITAEQLTDLTHGATLLTGKLDTLTRRAVHLQNNSLVAELPVAMYCHVFPDNACSVSCYIGLTYSPEEDDKFQLSCWLIESKVAVTGSLPH